MSAIETKPGDQIRVCYNLGDLKSNPMAHLGEPREAVKVVDGRVWFMGGYRHYTYFTNSWVRIRT